MYVKIVYNAFVFLQKDTDSELGEKIWLGHIVPNTFYDQFQGKTLWISDKRVELYGIGLYVEDIDIRIQWYEQISGISGSEMVYILYYDNPLQTQSHTKIVH